MAHAVSVFRRGWCLVLCAVALGVLGAILTGCEAESADEYYQGDVRISPSSITIGTGQTTTLTATGGDGVYAWTASNTGLGNVTGSGDTVVYTSTSTTGTNQVVVSDGTGASATATIVQQ